MCSFFGPYLYPQLLKWNPNSLLWSQGPVLSDSKLSLWCSLLLSSLSYSGNKMWRVSPGPVQSKGLLSHHHFITPAWTFFNFLGHSNHFPASGSLHLFLNLESLGYSSLSLNVTHSSEMSSSTTLTHVVLPIFLHQTVYCLHSFVIFFLSFTRI